MAQKKQFTLEDLNFGGTNYYKMMPERRFYEWWGEELVRLDVDEVYRLQMNGKGRVKEELLFSYDELEKVLSPDEGIFGINLLITTFPYADKPQALILTPKERLLFDFKTQKIVWRQKHKSSLEWNPKSRVDAFAKDNNLWLRMPDGTERQLTTDGSREIVYGRSVHRDEFGITKGTFWSPDGNALAFYRMDQSMVTDYPQVNTYTRIAEHAPDKYPMAGMTSHEVNVGIHDVKANKTIYLDLGKKATAFPCDSVTRTTDRFFTNISWSPDGKRIYLFELNRDQTVCTLDEYDATDGRFLRTIYTEMDGKYVEPLHPIAFLPWDSSKFLMFSQREGFMRLYLYDIKGNLIRKVTTDEQGKRMGNEEYVVTGIIGFNSKTKSVIAKTNISQNTSMVVASFSVDGKEADVLGASYGVSDAKLSAEGTYVLNHHSNPDVPRDYVLVNTDGRNTDGTLLFEAKEPWEGYAIPKISVGNITAADGKTNLKYRQVLPPDFDANRKYPTILYVYGGPHAHLVDDSRNFAARSWEIYMAQKGYIVYVLDNRGSENRGKAFEQATFRQLGQEEMKDQMKFVEYFTSLPYVDKERLGVHGWSFGGFMTISLMLNYPDVFKVGVAGGPVTDWKWYEVMYGERYMDTPEQNPEGYEKTSLIDKAGNLKGRLQIIIGANDPVVVPQHAHEFINACNEAGTQPDFYIYPGEEHNMTGHLSVHLHERITRYFEDFLK